MSDDVYSRKGFLGEFVSFVKRGISHQIDRKMTQVLDGPLRPPGALQEVEFLSTCTRCNACVEACPQRAILRMPVQAGLAAQTPYLDPNTEACHLCPDTPCITSCLPRALKPTTIEHINIGTAVVNSEHCMTFNDRVCTLCYDACPFPERAITIDENYHPRVLEACVGCGLCQKRCPEFPKAITVLSPMKFERKTTEDEYYFGLFKREEEEDA